LNRIGIEIANAIAQFKATIRHAQHFCIEGFNGVTIRRKRSTEIEVSVKVEKHNETP